MIEGILILDTHAEVFVWVGQSVDPKERQKAFEIGQKYIELAAALEGLSPDVPLYRVTEGNEPCFFATYFSWDGTKAVVQGNSFQKKLSLLFGTAFQASESSARSNTPNHGGATQRASALAALSSAFNPSSVPKVAAPKPSSHPRQGSQRAAAVAALSTVLTAEQKVAQSEGTANQFRSRSPSPEHPVADSENTDGASSEMGDPLEISAEGMEERESEDNGVDSELKEDSPVDDGGERIFSYERLKSKSRNPVRGIDYKRRESYLSDDEFQTVFGMTREAFYQQPKWKQDMHKKKVDLF